MQIQPNTYNILGLLPWHIRRTELEDLEIHTVYKPADAAGFLLLDLKQKTKETLSEIEKQLVEDLVRCLSWEGRFAIVLFSGSLKACKNSLGVDKEFISTSLESLAAEPGKKARLWARIISYT
jgi:hypothetical protein